MDQIITIIADNFDNTVNIYGKIKKVFLIGKVFFFSFCLTERLTKFLSVLVLHC